MVLGAAFLLLLQSGRRIHAILDLHLLGSILLLSAHKIWGVFEWSGKRMSGPEAELCDGKQQRYGTVPDARQTAKRAELLI